MDNGLLFPKYLNKGSKGPAVALLQCLLKDRGCNMENIVVDGDYGEQTARGVAELQTLLGIEPDGNFGPATRKALVDDDGGLDVNSILAAAFTGKTLTVGPEGLL